MLERNPRSVTYDELHTLCVQIFGQPRQHGSSHAVFGMPWPGDPRVPDDPRVIGQRGKNSEANPCQVKQVLAAIKKMEEQS